MNRLVNICQSEPAGDDSSDCRSRSCGLVLMSTENTAFFHKQKTPFQSTSLRFVYSKASAMHHAWQLSSAKTTNETHRKHSNRPVSSKVQIGLSKFGSIYGRIARLRKRVTILSFVTYVTPHEKQLFPCILLINIYNKSCLGACLYQHFGLLPAYMSRTRLLPTANCC